MFEEGIWVVACVRQLLFRVTLIHLVQIESLHHKVAICSSRDQIDLRSNPSTLLRDHTLVELEGSDGGGVVTKVGEWFVVMLSIVDQNRLVAST